jgi:site-specific DNA recombinase
MKAPSVKPVRCAIYTRVSTEHGLDQEFNSLDAQYDAASSISASVARAGAGTMINRPKMINVETVHHA